MLIITIRKHENPYKLQKANSMQNELPKDKKRQHKSKTPNAMQATLPTLLLGPAISHKSQIPMDYHVYA